MVVESIPSRTIRLARLLAAASAVAAASARAQDRIPVARADELPRHTYEVGGSASELMTSDAAFTALARQVRADIEADLAKYDVRDPAEVQRLLAVLMNLDMLAADYDTAVERVARIRALETQAAGRLASGLTTEAIVAARRQAPGDETGYSAAFRDELLRRLRALPWNVIENQIKAAKADADTFTENVLRAFVRQRLDPIVAHSGEISAEVAQQIVTARYMLDITIPLNPVRSEVCQTLIAANQLAARKKVCIPLGFDLPREPALAPVVVAVWDTGFDTSLFPGQLFVNPHEKLDGRDNDHNGFVDDVHGIAFDLDSNPTTGDLASLDALHRTAREAAGYLKGTVDIRAAIDSSEATRLKQMFAELEPEQFEPFREDLTLFSIYAHGTGVAAVAADGNPFIRLLNARSTFDHRSPRACPTIESTKADAAAMRAAVEYFKRNGVRVVNMSWGQNRSMIETGLEAHGAGATVEQRAQLARTIFQLYRDALHQAIEDAPEIVFVCGSTNFGNDVQFDEMIPGSFKLPNLLVVGAVDKYGTPTSFTGAGDAAQVYANGYEVGTYIPGGGRLAMSGVSIAVPGATNLAAKLLTLEPTLTPPQVIELIERGAKRVESKRLIRIVDPLKTVALLTREQRAREDG